MRPKRSNTREREITPNQTATVRAEQPADPRAVPYTVLTSTQITHVGQEFMRAPFKVYAPYTTHVRPALRIPELF